MMRKNLKSKLVFLILIRCILTGATARAQNTFKYKADLPKIDTSTVYRIKLAPALVARSNESLSDIRLLNDKVKFTAYTLSKNVFTGNSGNFVEFPQIKANNTSDTASVYIAQNKAGIKTHELWIRLKNTEVQRSVDIFGSDDLKKWFAIKEGIQLNQGTFDKEAEYSQLLQLPTSNYQYFKVQVNGKNKAPVKIIWAGIYVGMIPSEEFAQLPDPKFSSKDTAKLTHVYVQFDEPYQVNKLQMIVSAPNYFDRHISIYNDENNERISDTTISFRSPDIYLSAKTKKLRIDISNGDDVSLTIKTINAFEQQQYLVSYLEASREYAILSGDSTATTPDYDLSFLKDRSQDDIPVISHSDISNNPAYTTAKPEKKRNFTPLLWAAIIIVLALLSFLTWRMVREIEPKR